MVAEKQPPQENKTRLMSFLYSKSVDYNLANMLPFFNVKNDRIVKIFMLPS